MSVSCYQPDSNCVTCTKNRVNFYRHNKPMKTIPTLTSLEFVAINILGELVTTPHQNKYVLVILNHFSKIIHIVPLRYVTVECVTKAFSAHWVMAYGPPRILLSDNGKQLICPFLQHICKILGLRTCPQKRTFCRPLTKPSGTISLWASGSTTILNITLKVGTRIQTFSYSGTTLRSTGSRTVFLSSWCFPRRQRQSFLSLSLTLLWARRAVFHRWLLWLSHLVSNARAHTLREQKKYQRRLIKKVRPRKEKLQVRWSLFTRRKHTQHGKTVYKCLLIAKDHMRYSQ